MEAVSEDNVMRVLGNIEGKLDGIIENQQGFRDKVSSMETDISTLHQELREHKAKTLQDRDRVLGGLYVGAGFMSVVWTAVTFFKESIILFLTGKSPS